MKYPYWILGVVLTGAVTVTIAGGHSQPKGGSDDFGAYEPVANWLKPMRQGYLERGVSVFAESPNRIFYTSDLEFVPRRGPGGAGAPKPEDASPEHHWVMVVDGNGKLIEEWKQWDSLFKMPHHSGGQPDNRHGAPRLDRRPRQLADLQIQQRRQEAPHDAR